MDFPLNLTKLRASVFVPLIRYSVQLQEKLSAIIPSLIPFINTNDNLPLEMPGALYPPKSWALRADNGDYSIIFQPFQIDIIRAYPMANPFSLEDAWMDFAGVVKKLVEIVCESVNAPVSRMAISPRFDFMGSPDLWNGFIASQFANPSFQDHKMIEGNFMQIFRVDKTIRNKTYKINLFNRTDVVEEVRIVKDVPERMRIPLLEMDINTLGSDQNSFTIEDVDAFMHDAHGYCIEVLNFYFDGQL